MSEQLFKQNFSYIVARTIDDIIISYKFVLDKHDELYILVLLH